MVADRLPEHGLVLVSGPSRGGKSAWAEHLVRGWSGETLYLATGPEPGQDQSWALRVQAHQQRRPSAWRCLDVGGALVERLELQASASPPDQTACLLIDSLGTWLAWHLDDPAAIWSARCDALMAALALQPGPVVLVVEETGWGVVPATAIGGLFRDRLGALQQRLMGHCQAAWLVVAGRALNLLELGVAVPTA